MCIRKRWAMMVFLLVFAAAQPAAAIGLEVAIGGWNQNPSGDLGYKPLSSIDILDVEDDLNYDDETRFMGRVKIDMPLVLPNIYIMATPMEFDGAGQKNVDFQFGDINFNANVPFDSKAQLDHLDVALFYGIPLLETATFDKLNIDVGINFRIIDYDLSVNQPTTGLNEQEDGTLPVPMVFVAAQFRPLEWLGLEAEVRGISYSGNSVYSLIGRIKGDVYGPVFVGGGYRYDKIKLDEDDIDVDIDFSGPFLEAGFSF